MGWCSRLCDGNELERQPIILRVDGDPVPQGSKRCFNNRVVDANSVKLKAWRKEVTSVATTYLHEHGWHPFQGPVQLRITFYMPRPKSVSYNKRPLPIISPDLDKLVRSIGDSLTDAGVWGDDAQVVSLACEKVYADDKQPGADIEIHSVTV